MPREPLHQPGGQQGGRGLHLVSPDRQALGALGWLFVAPCPGGREALKRNETCPGDVGERGHDSQVTIGGDSQFWRRTMNSSPSPLAVGVRWGLSGESAWGLVAAPSGKICVTFRSHFPLECYFLIHQMSG
jgi:hypothetical protein